MTAILAEPLSEVVAAAEKLLARRTGAAVRLVDPVDLGGSGRTIVLITHEIDVAARAERNLVIDDGLITQDRPTPRAAVTR